MTRGITVCVPAYRPKLSDLAELLGSVRDQVERAAAIVVTQDPDASGLVLDATALPDVGIPTRVELNKKRLGMVGNWNRCVQLAETELVILLGQDDVLTPTACRHHESTLRHNPYLTMSASVPAYISADGVWRPTNQRSVGPTRLFAAEREYILDYQTLVDLSLIYGNLTGEPCGACFRRSSWEEVGGYSADFAHAADLDFTLRLARLAKHVGLTTRSLSRRRIHYNNLTRQQIMDGTTSHDRRLLVERYGMDAASDEIRERAQARLYTHDLFDVLRTRGRRRPHWPRAYDAKLSAILRDLWENIGGVPIGRGIIRQVNNS